VCEEDRSVSHFTRLSSRPSVCLSHSSRLSIHICNGAAGRRYRSIAAAGDCAQQHDNDNHHYHRRRVAGEGRRVVVVPSPCPRSTARLQSSPLGRVESFRSWSSTSPPAPLNVGVRRISQWKGLLSNQKSRTKTKLTRCIYNVHGGSKK